MAKRKSVKLMGIYDVESVKLRWKVARQVQEELLEEKLAQRFLGPNDWKECMQQYPVAMQPMIVDFMRKAEEQTRLLKRSAT